MHGKNNKVAQIFWSQGPPASWGRRVRSLGVKGVGTWGWPLTKCSGVLKWVELHLHSPYAFTACTGKLHRCLRTEFGGEIWEAERRIILNRMLQKQDGRVRTAYWRTVWTAWGQMPVETGPNWMLLWHLLMWMELVSWVSWATVSGRVTQNISIAASLSWTLTALQLALFDFSKPSGHYMYRQFKNQQFCVLPTQCIYVFFMDLRINSHYFPVQH